MSAFDVSVVIPLYNKQAFVRDMLASVLAQSLPAAEIIIVDDSSTDGSVAKIADLIGGQVRLLSQPNAGPGPARNRGIAEASSAWIAFIDADDQWQPNHLATLAEVAAHCPDAAVVATRHQRMTATDPLPAPDNSPVAARRIDFFRDAQQGEILSSTSVAVRRAALTEAGGFGAFYPGEDFELWTRLALDHVIALSQRFTALYLQQTGGLMEQHEAMATATAERQPIFDTLDRVVGELMAAAAVWQPTEQEAFGALVANIPTVTDFVEAVRHAVVRQARFDLHPRRMEKIAQRVFVFVGIQPPLRGATIARDSRPLARLQRGAEALEVSGKFRRIGPLLLFLSPSVPTSRLRLRIADCGIRIAD